MCAGFGGIEVNEKDLMILEQYNLQVRNARRGRGSFLCETDQGLVQVTEFSGSKERLYFQNRVLQYLQEKGMRADLMLENQERELVSEDRYGNGYVVKKWFLGRECDTKSYEDITEAVKYLAELHQMLRLPEQKPSENVQEIAAEENGQDMSEETVDRTKEYNGEPLEEELNRHTREMKKVRNYMRTRKQKTAFERRFLQVYDGFAAQAQGALEQLKTSGASALYRQCIRERRICHGDYSQHNILFDDEGTAAVNFARCCFDAQIADFYYFFRKIMEKQGWNQRLGMEMIHIYQEVRPLSNAEFENFCIRLTYPEKFWKLSNHYFNRNKAWIPEKNLQKLEMLMAQEKRRMDFVKFLH